MKKILSFAVSLVALIVLAGCGSGSVAGKWTGKPDTAKIMASIPPAQQAEAKKAFDKMSVGLDMKDDKTFVLTVTGAPMNVPPMEGTWEQKDKTITLSPKDKKEDPANAVLSDDGKSMKIDDPKNGMSVTLTKA